MLQRQYLLLITLLLLTGTAQSQVKLGLQVSPTLSTNRISSDSDSLTMSTDGAALRFSFGSIVDVPFSEHYFFSSGLFIVSKRAGIKASWTGNAANEEYNLQYIQIPLSLKLFTSEISLDKKIYFQFGTTLEFSIKDEPADNTNFLINNFKLFDSSLLAAIGVEYQLGLSTALFGGFSYHRGLINSISEQVESDTDIKFKNDYLALDIGIKF